MTSIPTSRPAIPMSRPSAGAPHAATGPVVPAVDPIKLVKKYKWILLGAALAGAFLGTVVHVVWLMTSPIYSSMAYYECFPLEDGTGRNQQAPGAEDEFKRFMATQVQVMNSERIIDKALADPRFTKEVPKWSG